MKKYNYIVIDDDNMDRIAINFYLKNSTFLEHRVSFSNAKDAYVYLENNNVDIVFTDIDMPGMDGLELQEKIRDKSLITVFITSHPEFAIEGFELEAFDYIIKPLREERFIACVNRIKEYLDVKFKAFMFDSSFKDGSILIKKGREYTGIKLQDIVYLEALKDYTKLISYDSRSITIHGNLASTLRDENFNNFIRVHRSFAVKRNYIHLIRTNEVVLNNEATVPLGLYYKEDLMKALS